MSLTTKQVVLANELLNRLIKLDSENKIVLYSSVRIRLAANHRQTQPVFEAFEKERNALIKKLGTEQPEVISEDGKVIKEAQVTLSPKDSNWLDFVDQVTAAMNEPTDVVLRPIYAYELAGVSKAVYEDANSDVTKQNNVPYELITALVEVGLLTE